MKYTGDQLQKMKAQEFTEATSKLPLDVRLKLAMLSGAGDEGIDTYEGKDMSNGKFYHEKLNYDELADLLNSIEDSYEKWK